MVAFTPRAVEAALRAITTADEPALGLRLTAEGGGCSGPDYSLGLEDIAEADDTVLEFEGLKVFVDPASLTLAEGANVDYVEDERGAVFVFSNPAKRKGAGGCGCGGHG